MQANNIRKGFDVRFADGTEGTMLDNKKGVIRRMSCEFNGRIDDGDQYMHTVTHAKDPGTNEWHRVEFTPAQAKKNASIISMDALLGGL